MAWESFREPVDNVSGFLNRVKIGFLTFESIVFDPNPTEVEAMTIEFNDSAEAIVHIKFFGQPVETWPIGLDGVYHLFPGEFNLPRGLRGRWIDDQTFAFEYDTIANNDHGMYSVRYEGDRVIFSGQETAHEVGVSTEGRLVNP